MLLENNKIKITVVKPSKACPFIFWNKLIEPKTIETKSITKPKKVTICIGAVEKDEILLKAYLTNLYKDSKCLWELDFDRAGFEYIDADNTDQSLYIYARFAKKRDDHYLIVMNCTVSSRLFVATCNSFSVISIFPPKIKVPALVQFFSLLFQRNLYLILLFLLF